jgi:hypothetical protein
MVHAYIHVEIYICWCFENRVLKICVRIGDARRHTRFILVWTKKSYIQWGRE